MPRPVRFESSVFLAAPPETVFAFHANPRNMLKIMPSSKRIEIVDSEEARPGGRFSIRLHLTLITLDWEGIWEKVEPPHFLADTAAKSPFRFWRHEHEFAPEASGTRMTDRVECLPKYLPAFAASLAIPFVLIPMFKSRHSATAAYFSKTANP